MPDEYVYDKREWKTSKRHEIEVIIHDCFTPFINEYCDTSKQHKTTPWKALFRAFDIFISDKMSTKDYCSWRFYEGLRKVFNSSLNTLSEKGVENILDEVVIGLEITKWPKAGKVKEDAIKQYSNEYNKLVERAVGNCC